MVDNKKANYMQVMMVQREEAGWEQQDKICFRLVKKDYPIKFVAGIV